MWELKILVELRGQPDPAGLNAPRAQGRFSHDRVRRAIQTTAVHRPAGSAVFPSP